MNTNTIELVGMETAQPVAVEVESNGSNGTEQGAQVAKAKRTVFSFKGYQGAADKAQYLDACIRSANLVKATLIRGFVMQPKVVAEIGAEMSEALAVIADEAIKCQRQLIGYSASVAGEVKAEPARRVQLEAGKGEVHKALTKLVPLACEMARYNLTVRYGKGGVAELSAKAKHVVQALELGSGQVVAARLGAVSRKGEALANLAYRGTLNEVFEWAKAAGAVSGNPARMGDKLRKLVNAGFDVAKASEKE